MPTQSRSVNGFSLVELLVVIAIIGILIAMLLPAVQYVRESSRRSTCLNNLRQHGISLSNFESARGVFPAARYRHPNDEGTMLLPVGTTNRPGKARSNFHHWGAHLLGFIEQNNVADLYDFNVPWYDPTNLPAVGTQIAVWQCPSASDGSERSDPLHRIGAAAGDYGSINEIRGKIYKYYLDPPIDPSPDQEARDGALVKWKETKMSELRDGTSNTIFLTEQAGHPYAYSSKGLVVPEMMDQYKGGKIKVFNNQCVVEDGTGWADPDSGFAIEGSSEDGMDETGPRLINAINASEIFSFHSGGVNAAFCDGSARFISASTNNRALVALLTRQGGEPIVE